MVSGKAHEASLRDLKGLFQQSWASADSGKAFKQAMEERGYFLARGDRRAVVAVDVYGEVYAVARWANVKSKDVMARMGDLGALATIEDAQKTVAGLVRQKMTSFIGLVSTDFANAAQAIETTRRAMVERHAGSYHGVANETARAE